MTSLARIRTIVTAGLAAASIAACSSSDSTAPTPAVTTGSLTVTITGLPASVTPSVTVTGPNAYSQTLTASNTATVTAGTYTATATPVTAGGVRYNPTIAGSPATVNAGGTSTITVTYAVGTLPTAILQGTVNADRTLRADTTYILRGFTYVASGATLTIDAGTRIVGDTTALGSALFVLRGARIVANGTATAPIVFTSQRSAGNRQPGDWGGLIIVGNARNNRSGSIIVEGSDGSVLGAQTGGVVYTGGTNDADNSGTLRYVRVEFAGYATLPDAELNSFTFAAVGSGTTFEYLQSVSGLDDSFEWFGGTVDGKYLVSYESGDDHFDTSEGYRGRNQFLIAYQSTFLTPRAGAGAISADPQGFEVDGCNGGGCTAPSGANAQSSGRDDGLWTMNMFANYTLIGVGATQTTPTNGGIGAVLRRGTGGYYFNGVIARWPRQAISMRDSTTNNRFLADSLFFKNNYLAENGLQNSGVIFDPTGTNFGQEAAFTARNQTNTVGGATVTAASLFTALPAGAATTTAANFDWTPAAGSPIATGGLNSFSADPRIAARAGSFIVPTAYRGAADPASTTKWWAGWTSYARN